jgi:hypothetical protein
MKNSVANLPTSIEPKEKKMRRRKRDKVKPFNEYAVAKSGQMQLFELVTGEDDYSQTVELYDFMPKYVWGKVERIEGRFLDRLERQFECRGVRYTLKIDPAKTEDADGTVRDYYPGKREDLVEDALRKIMADGQGVHLDDGVGVAFTLYQLQQELKQRGHTYSYDQLKQAIQILFGTDIHLSNDKGTVQIAFSPIETYGFKGENEETQTFVKFSPLITLSIHQGNYRLINYEKVMAYQSVIARQLHKRMSHHYTQASLTEPYQILLTTMIRDFGLTTQKQLRNNHAKVEEAILEMKNQNVILGTKAERIFEVRAKNKLVDVKFSIQPHPEFIGEVRKANARVNKIKIALNNT